MSCTGTIFQIQRFSLDDGPGIRTTVFLKGCPLRCTWCHNPESFSANLQLRYQKNFCIECANCASVCPNGVHQFLQDGHIVHFDKCATCGKCLAVCPTQALSIVGEKRTPEQVMETVKKDIPYYKESGGGVTFSGGEAAMQQDFLYQLLSLAKAQNIHTCLDTSGYVPFDYLKEIAPMVDLFLYDYKIAGSKGHRHYTGVNNEKILSNLYGLHALGASIVLRCPIIPGINDIPQHFESIQTLAMELPNLKGIEIMPYHNIGAKKWEETGLPYSLSSLPSATLEDKNKWQSLLPFPFNETV